MDWAGILGSLKTLYKWFVAAMRVLVERMRFLAGMGFSGCPNVPYPISQPKMPDVATATITVGSMEKRAAIDWDTTRAMSSCGLWEIKCGAITDSNTQAGAASSVRAMRGERVLFFNKKKPSRRVE